jgi:hypothetical protein
MLDAKKLVIKVTKVLCRHFFVVKVLTGNL